MTAPRFQTGEGHQTSPASLRGGERDRCNKMQEIPDSFCAEYAGFIAEAIYHLRNMHVRVIIRLLKSV